MLPQVMLGCSQPAGVDNCSLVCQWTGPPPFSCPVLATLGGRPGMPASNCSGGITASYEYCNSTQDMNKETSDGQARRSSKIWENGEKKNISGNCCCTLRIREAGEDQILLSKVKSQSSSLKLNPKVQV